MYFLSVIDLLGNIISTLMFRALKQSCVEHILHNISLSWTEDKQLSGSLVIPTAKGGKKILL